MGQDNYRWTLQEIDYRSNEAIAALVAFVKAYEAHPAAGNIQKLQAAYEQAKKAIVNRHR